MTERRSLSATRPLLLPALMFGLTTTLAAQGVQPGPITVRRDIHHDVSPPLRDLIRKAPPPSLERHEAEPVGRIPLPPGLVPLAEDPVRQRTTIPPTQIVGLSFEGLGQGQYGFNVTSIPPDTNGAVGATQYVQWVNTSFAIFDKSNGVLIAGPTDGNTLWSGFGNGCETDNDGDPIAIYDKLANRWVMSQFAGVRTMGPYLQCIAVSTTSDATGTWNRYSFQYGDLDDYPKMGVWPDAYYETFNLFNTHGVFIGSKACAYDRTAMLNGQSATEVCFPPNPYSLGLLPADVDGTRPPPAGSPNYMLSYGANVLNLYQFHVDFNTPANSTFTGPTVIPVAAFSPLCGGDACVPQPGTYQQLDSLADRLMYRLAYRNFGSHESLVVNHSVAVNSGSGGGGVRWYEIQSPGGTPTVAQQGTFAPDSNYRWMGSVAMDRAGDLAVGYSISSSSIYPSIAFAGRVPTDPPGTLEAETGVALGNGAQMGDMYAYRWGDYSAMTVDPVDDCTFWYTQEYIQSNGEFNWNTRIVSFRFPGCGTVSAPPTQFVAVPPCRLLDTRTQGGGIQGGTFQTFPLPQLAQSGGCASLSSAAAYSLNVTVVPQGPLGYLTVWPAGQPQPVVSTMNSLDGRVKANAAVAGAGTNGAVNIFASNTTDVVLDIDGYFAPIAGSTLAFYPLPPCRVADTRNANGWLGGPYLQGGHDRDFPILDATSCNIPSSAQAYSLNITAVPRVPLGFLTVWPAGQSRPAVSTLNATTGTVTANAAIVPGGDGGDISVYPSNDTDLVIDIDGYFAAQGQGGLSLYSVAPCRVLDTRNGNGAFVGQLTVDVVDSVCQPPYAAQSYVFNATVVPSGALGYLTLWADGAGQPVVATLNAVDGAVTSNMAIVPTNNGSIDGFATNLTQLILDISSYFAP